jgi:hypothetical protein
MKAKSGQCTALCVDNFTRKNGHCPYPPRRDQPPVMIWRIMPSRRYRKNAEECRDHAARSRNSQDRDAWLAEEWQKLVEKLDAEQQQSRKFWKRAAGVAPKHQPGSKIRRKG